MTTVGVRSGDAESALRLLTIVTLALGATAAAAGLFWTPGTEGPDTAALHGRGLYRRDTPFTAGGAEGSDLLGLLCILPAGLWALLRGARAGSRLVLVAVHAWWLYLGASLAFGAVAFNELFPVYVLLMPVSAAGLALSLHGLALPRPPRALSPFLIACGAVTGSVWSLLLGLEMSDGAFPPESYYTVRTTYAMDLGLIAPGCIAAGLALSRGWRWGVILALPLLSIAALLLPMMTLQTLMQIGAGVVFGPEAAVPFVGFALVSGGAAWFLVRSAGSLRIGSG